MSDTNTLAVQPAPKASALQIMASKYNVEPKKLLDTLKNTVFRGATDDELAALVVVANEYGLNPLCKEIYAFPAKGGGIVPVVSIDGWIRMMNDHPQFDGIEYEELLTDSKLAAITAIIYRKDRGHPTRVTEWLSECRRNTEPWKMEHRMLRHKATIQGARVAFGFSGITDEDEAQATPGLARDVTPKAARAVPLDPFTLPAAEVEQIEPAKDELKNDGALLDLLDAIEAANSAAELTTCATQSAEVENEAHRTMAKKAVVEKAKALECVWNKATAQYLPV